MAELALAITARNQAQAVLNQLKKDIGGVSERLRGMGSGLQSVGGKLTAGVTLPILGLGGAALKIAGDFEQTQIALTTMLGNADKANTLFNEMREFSASTPFEFPQIAEAGKMLLAFGISSEKVIPKLKSLGDIASGVGIPISDLTLIYGQASVAGRVMTGDLNQLVGRGVPIISALSKVMGVAEKDVRKLAEEGKVSFADFDRAIGSLTENGGQFAGMMDAQSQSLLGLFSTFKDNITLTLGDVGKVLIDTFDLKGKLASVNEFLSGLSQKIAGFAQNNPEMFKLAVSIAAVAAAIGPVLVGVGMLMTALAPVTAVIAGISWPVWVLIGAVALLGAAWVTNFGGIQEKTQAVLDFLRPGFEELLGWISAAAKGDFGPLKEGLQGALTKVTATIQEFKWSDFVTALTDWGTYIVSLDWASILPVPVWNAYVTALSWVNIIAALDWATFVPVISSWADYIVSLPWGTYIAALTDWGAYIGTLAWSTILPVLTDWGAYIVALDWTAIIVQLVDWATWIPALAWAGFVTALAWSAYIAVFSWSTYVSVLNWTAHVAILSWRSFVNNLTWENFVKAVEWGVYLTKLPWSAYLTAVQWSAWLVKIAWTSFIDKVRWLDYIAKMTGWNSFVPPLTWSSFVKSIDLGSYIPDFGSWADYVWAYFNSGGAPTPPNNAVGTSNWRGGLTRVGETGPETVWLPPHSRIFSPDESMQLAGGGEGISITINATFTDALDINQLAHQVADIISRRQRGR